MRRGGKGGRICINLKGSLVSVLSKELGCYVMPRLLLRIGSSGISPNKVVIFCKKEDEKKFKEIVITSDVFGQVGGVNKRRKIAVRYSRHLL